jgi:peptidoglycan-associated lipoprotein
MAWQQRAAALPISTKEDSMNSTQAHPAFRATIGLWVLLASAALVACSTPVKLDNNLAPVESRDGGKSGSAPVAKADTPASTTPAAPQSRVTPVEVGGADANAMANMQRVVYFDFDSYVVKDEFRGVVDGHAKLLATDRKKRVQVEGHTDERGGREYNLALGQKRAESVAKSLALLGANDAQIEAVSFGKERPAAPGSDEAAWAKNRRAELVLR